MQAESPTYQGQFGPFTITPADRRGVVIYRSALALAALCFAAGTALGLWGPPRISLTVLTPLYGIFCLALGMSLLTIHIYLVPLHRLLQAFWLIGMVAAIVVGTQSSEPLAIVIIHRPITLLGLGFTFAALTGIFFKEAFCFDRLETKLLTLLIPVLLLGHLIGGLPPTWERRLLLVWAGLFLVFAGRKMLQPIPPDIGDKSVFEHLQSKAEV